jgi:hypothetical protein
MYNVLEKLRSGEALTAKEKGIHEQGLVSVLKQIHDELDAVVFEAYGWPPTLTDEEILERLVALNHERAEEEKRGLVRWLRPEFQNPRGQQAPIQTELPPGEVQAKAAGTRKGGEGRRSWPREFPAQVAAVRDLLAERGSLSIAAAKATLTGSRSGQLATALDSLTALGLAAISEGGKERVWVGLDAVGHRGKSSPG